MYRLLIVSADRELLRKLEEYASDAGLLGEVTALTHYPAAAEMSRQFNIKRPQIVIALVNDIKETRELLAGLTEYGPNIPFVGISQVADNRTLSWLMNQGAKACLSQPLNRHLYVDTIKRLLAESDTLEQGAVASSLYSFLPAKGGSGCSTLAANFANAAAHAGRGRVLLLDLDQGSGWSRSMIPSHGVHTLIDILEAGAPIDEQGWRRFVSRFENLDLIAAGRPNPRHPLLASQLRQMLDYAVGQYKLTCADLSGNFEAFSVEVMRRSKNIFLVTSTDVATLSLAQHRARLLQSLDLLDKTSLLLTRMAERPEISAADVRRDVGLPVAAEIRLDDRKVRDWLTQGELIQKDHGVWKQIQKASTQFFWPLDPPASGGISGFFSR